MPAAAKIQTTKSPLKPRSPAPEGRTGIVRTERNCSVARTLDIVSDAWAFLIIREAFFGTQTFEAFRSALGIPRATLTDRLRKLTQLAIFRQVAPGSSQRKEYRLTKMGFDLYPSFIALMQFGDRWLFNDKPRPLTLIHAACGHDSHPIVTCSHCGEGVGARDAKYRARPPKFGFARTLEIIGDKWSFMVVREGFFGNRRYDKILTELAIAPNILTDRLNRLVASGVFYRRQYQSSPDRYEYLLTDMGLDLYGPFIAMLRWGDRWLSKGKPPLILTHLKCGHDFQPSVKCDQCKQPIVAADMRYRLTYDPQSFGALGPRSVD
jgi:DNA-binding HxlR family transcriptional regulator